METFEEIYLLYFKDIYHYTLSLCQDPILAEEITQETFYQAMKNIKDFRGDCKMTVWLCQIAKHLFFSHAKKMKRSASLDLDHGKIYHAPLSSDVSYMEQKVLDQEEAMIIHKHLHNLKDPYKEVFMLRVFGELSFHKIARIFGKTESWSRVTYHRAKLKILKEMEEKP